jgi:hypothetical protein
MIIDWNRSFVSSAISYLQTSSWEVTPIEPVSFDRFDSSIFWLVRPTDHSDNLMRLRENQSYLMQFRTVSSHGFEKWQKYSLSKIQPQIPMASLLNSYIFRHRNVDLGNYRFGLFYVNRNNYDVEIKDVFAPEISMKRIEEKSDKVLRKLKIIRESPENTFERTVKHCAMCPFVNECQK